MTKKNTMRLKNHSPISCVLIIRSFHFQLIEQPLVKDADHLLLVDHTILCSSLLHITSAIISRQSLYNLADSAEHLNNKINLHFPNISISKTCNEIHISGFTLNRAHSYYTFKFLSNNINRLSIYSSLPQSALRQNFSCPTTQLTLHDQQLAIH